MIAALLSELAFHQRCLGCPVAVVAVIAELKRIGRGWIV